MRDEVWRFIPHPSSLIPYFLALGSLLLYLTTIAPSLGGTIDSAEFQQATYTLSTVHPTGYPLYLMLGRLWITIFPFGDPAFRVNLLSAIFAALAVWVLFSIIVRLTGSRGLTHHAPILAGASGAALFAVQPVPWAQAGVAEINSMNTLLVGLSLLAMLEWSVSRLPLPAVGFAYGLALSHHRQALLYFPIMLLLGVAAMRWGAPGRITGRQVALSLVLLLLPFAAYFYIPLRSGTWEGFWPQVLGESALPVISGALERPLLPRFRALTQEQIFLGAQGLGLLALGLLGVAFALVRVVRPWASASMTVEGREPRMVRWAGAVAFILALAFFMGVGFATLYDILDVSDYLAVPVFVWCALAGVGVAALMGIGGTLARTFQIPLRPVGPLVLVTMAALCVFTAYRSLHRPDIRVDFSGLDRMSYWSRVIEQSSEVERGAFLVADWPEANEARYIQQVEGWRPDLTITIIDYLLAADTRQVDQWLTEGRAVYMVGDNAPMLTRYEAERQGALWRLTGRKPEGAEEEAPPMAHGLDRRYGGNIVLLGYTIEPDPPVVSAGGVLRLTLYWQATGSISERYVIFNHIVDSSGAKIGQQDDEPGRGFKPTFNWKRGETVTDTFVIGVSRDARPGSYSLLTGLYTRLDLRSLPAFAKDGTALGEYPQLTQVEVR